MRSWRTRVAGATGIAFIFIAALKIFNPIYLCADPWEDINAAFMIAEMGLGWAMLYPGRGRRIGSLLGASITAGAAVILSIVHFSGRDVDRCGCFGPVELPYGAHMVVCAMLFSACVIAMQSETEHKRQQARVARVFD